MFEIKWIWLKWKSGTSIYLPKFQNIYDLSSLPSKHEYIDNSDIFSWKGSYFLFNVNEPLSHQ